MGGGWKISNRYFGSSLLVAVTERKKLTALSMAWKNFYFDSKKIDPEFGTQVLGGDAAFLQQGAVQDKPGTYCRLLPLGTKTLLASSTTGL